MSTYRLFRRRPVIASAWLLTIVAASSVDTGAQGLGDVARKEAERRQQVQGGKRYTNTDLPNDSGPTPPAAAPSAPVTTPAHEKKPASLARDSAAVSDAVVLQPGDSKTSSAAPSARDSRSEAFWRQRAQDVRAQLQQCRTQVSALEARLGVLNGQAATAAVVSEREVTLQALQRAQKATGYLQDEWHRLEAKARGSQIPMEWIQ